jgi:ABC-type bacteriocin/lantibiotic exporter with double-glycine peptidase domain
VKGQSQKYTCGATAFANALEARGHDRRLTEEEAVALCGTTPLKGTPIAGLKKATKKMGLGVVDWTLPWDNAWARLRVALQRGAPVLLAVDQGEHWVTAVGLLDGRVLVYDPAKCDLFSWGAGELTAAWKDSKGKFYGLEVG